MLNYQHEREISHEQEPFQFRHGLFSFHDDDFFNFGIDPFSWNCCFLDLAGNKSDFNVRFCIFRKDTNSVPLVSFAQSGNSTM